uniref:Uncharacterized protein n=1 Tax=Anguilla anguilla TaxID=7936 RepID=A0A0E9RRH7_ANGAN
MAVDYFGLVGWCSFHKSFASRAKLLHSHGGVQYLETEIRGFIMETHQLVKGPPPHP